MSLPITRGTRVKFDKDGTTLTGTIFHFTSNIENGRKMAVIELEHELPGVIETVPFDQLTHAPISQDTALISAYFDSLLPEMSNRLSHVALSNMPNTASVFRDHFESTEIDDISIHSLRAS